MTTTRFHLAQYHPGPRKQRGLIGIIGVLLAIIIAALVLFFAVKTFDNARHTNEASSEAAHLAVMIAKAQALYQTDPNGFTDATDTILIQNGVVPSSEVQNGTQIESMFGTPVTVGPSSLYGGTGNALSFEYTAVPEAMCSSFIQDVATNVIRIQVGGSTVQDTSQGQSLSRSELGTACASGSDSGSVTATFTIGK